MMIYLSIIIGNVFGHLTAHFYRQHNYVGMWLSIAGFLAWVAFLFFNYYRQSKAERRTEKGLNAKSN